MGYLFRKLHLFATYYPIITIVVLDFVLIKYLIETVIYISLHFLHMYIQCHLDIEQSLKHAMKNLWTTNLTNQQNYQFLNSTILQSY